MKKLIVLAIVALLIGGCSSKQVTYDPMGRKQVTTKTSEDTYHEQQAAAWAGYFQAIANPPVIAMFEKDGVVVTIHSQIPPPVPTIRQHKNQVIGPIVDLAKWGIGGTVAYGITRAVVRGAGDINVANSGDGTVITDRSDNIASKSNTELATDTDRSDRSMIDNTDNSVIDSHDQTATPTIVEQPPVQVIEKDVVVIDQPVLPEVTE
jgi:uncharacterized protein YceK